MKRQKRCHYCNGRFGLIRHYYGLKAFCSNKRGKRCKERHIEEQTLVIASMRFRRWLAS